MGMGRSGRGVGEPWPEPWPVPWRVLWLGARNELMKIRAVVRGRKRESRWDESEVTERCIISPSEEKLHASGQVLSLRSLRRAVRVGLSGELRLLAQRQRSQPSYGLGPRLPLSPHLHRLHLRR